MTSFKIVRSSSLVVVVALLLVLTVIGSLIVPSAKSSILFVAATNVTSTNVTSTSETTTTTETTVDPTTSVPTNTSTTMTATTTTTTAVASTNYVNASFPNIIYVNQTIRAPIELSKAVSSSSSDDDARLDVICYVQPQPFYLMLNPTNISFSKSMTTMKYTNVTATGVPAGKKSYMVYFDIQLQGPSSKDYLIASTSSSSSQQQQSPASSALVTIEIRSLETVSILDSIPSTMTFGEMKNLRVNVSALPPSDVQSGSPTNTMSNNSGIFITPQVWLVHDDERQGAPVLSQDITFSPSVLTYHQKNNSRPDSTLRNITLHAGSAATPNGTSLKITWKISGDLSFAYATPSASSTVRVVSSTATTTATTTSPSTTVAPSTTAHQQQQTSSTPQPPPPMSTTSTTEVSVNPSSPPPGWLIVKMLNNSRLTEAQQSNMRNKLASWLGYPASQLSVGQPNAAGDVLVLLLAPSAGSGDSLNQTAVDEALRTAATLDSTQLGQLGAAAIIEGTLSPPTTTSANDDDDGSSPDLNWPIVGGCAAAGLIILVVLVVLFKKNGDGSSGNGNGNDTKPFSHMENEMDQHTNKFPRATVRELPPGSSSSSTYQPPPIDQTPADAPVIPKRAYTDIDEEL